MDGGTASAMQLRQKIDDVFAALDITNAFGEVLDQKLVAEKYLRSSGLDHCPVRQQRVGKQVFGLGGNLVKPNKIALFRRCAKYQPISFSGYGWP